MYAKHFFTAPFYDNTIQISSNLHEHLLLASSLEIEKCRSFYLRFLMVSFAPHMPSALFEKHLAHRNSIKDVGPILGNFLLAAETEVCAIRD